VNRTARKEDEMKIRKTVLKVRSAIKAGRISANHNLRLI
jgi:hypothetical protein